MYRLLCFLEKKVNPRAGETLTSVEMQIERDDLCQLIASNESDELEINISRAESLLSALCLSVTVQRN